MQFGGLESAMRIERYQKSQKQIWDDFVRSSKNGTFLFLRDYMDYHSDRFEDYSLLVYDDSRLVALLPANAEAARLESHGGLTYGGFVTASTMKLPLMLQVFEATSTYLKQNGFTSWLYKTIPYFYTRIPAEEDRYALFICHASLVRRGVLTVVYKDCRLPFQARRNRGIKRAQGNHLHVMESEDFASFWTIVGDMLWERYQTHPVHTLEEIRLLHSRFPNNIRLYACYQDTKMLAGVVIYESTQVARAQYIASSSLGKKLGALDLLFHVLLDQIYADKLFFDFGTSDEENGRRLNQGLIDQKEGFGARAVMHDHYEIDLSCYNPGQYIGSLI